MEKTVALALIATIAAFAAVYAVSAAKGYGNRKRLRR
jgi:hypothetical protein